MSGKSPEEIEAEIAAQREELAATVDQLTAKLDVKANAQRKAADLKDRATTGTGSPRPEVLAAAGSLIAMAIALVWWRRTR
ncbi:DUF3618 domain-containing protein [Nocardioides euryhalodurans]|uniref:DUF3618 domain-containing protein n=1 Tax=Nocardioides euryhalodurans TaxID=2518370 RepID=A0A4P7GI82_9ACTN|nr:DUF3618 domain-containing protein [Nocardioides euryhalodurans]QBR91606.1 DUF3618 domain-containing protein [Nocardioides euryhalodurans]